MRDLKKIKENEITGTEEALARIISNLGELSEKTIDTMTDVTPEEVFYLSWLESTSDVFDSSLVKKFINKFKTLRVSRLRLGRKEAVLLGAGIREFGKMDKKKVTIGDLFGGF